MPPIPPPEDDPTPPAYGAAQLKSIFFPSEATGEKSILDERLVIRLSPVKSFGLGILSVAMTIICGVIALGFLGHTAGEFVVFIAWIGVFFFGAATFLWLRQGGASRKLAITLDRDGLHDPRVSRLPIPWAAIEDVYSWSMNFQNIMVIQVPREIEAAIGLTRIARITREMNARLGADGLCIAASGLQIGYDDLARAVFDRVIAAKAAQAAAAMAASSDGGAPAP